MFPFLHNSEVHCHVHKLASQIPILSQMIPIHILQIFLSKIHFNIILPSTPISSECSLPFRLYKQNCIPIHLPHALCVSGPSDPPRFDQPNDIWRRVKIMCVLITQFSRASCHSILLSSSCFETLLTCGLPLIWEFRFQTHTKQPKYPQNLPIFPTVAATVTIDFYRIITTRYD
jgi:hypothetical protein